MSPIASHQTAVPSRSRQGAPPAAASVQAVASIAERPFPFLHVLIHASGGRMARRVRGVLEREFPGSQFELCGAAAEAVASLERSAFDAVVLAWRRFRLDDLRLPERLARHPTPMPVTVLLRAADEDRFHRRLGSVDPDWSIATIDGLSDAGIARVVRRSLARHELKWRSQFAHQALRSSVSQFDHLFHEVPDLIFTCDRAGCLLEVNATAERLLAAPRESFLLKPVDEAFGLDRALVETLLANAEHPRGPIRDLEVEFHRADGQKLHGLAHVVAFSPGPRRPVRFQGVIKDITELKRLEGLLRDHAEHLERRVEDRTRELRRTTDLLESILEGSTENAILGLDAAGRFLHFSRGAQLIFGHEPAQVIGRQGLDLLIDLAGTEFGGGAELLRRVDACRVLVLELPMRALSGRRLVAHLSINRLADAPADQLAYVAIARDVTEAKRLEQLLKQYNETLEREVERKIRELDQKHIELIQSSKLATLGEMATGIAHELNQPLSGIRLRAQLLLRSLQPDGEAAARLAAGLEEIIGFVDRITRIVNHIRVFARQDEQPFRPFPPHLSVEGCLSLIGEQLRLHAIEVEVDLPEDLPCVFGEASQIEQVLLNLVGNARDALNAKAESPRVGAVGSPYEKRLRISGVLASPDEVRLSVEDNGPGFDDAVKARLFEPFFTTKPVGQGTGLGLSISYGIVAKHRGRIEVVARPGEGARFDVYLPVAEEPSPGGATPAAGLSVGAGAAPR